MDVLVGAGQTHPAPVGYSILDCVFDGVEEGDGMIGLLGHGHGVVNNETEVIHTLLYIIYPPLHAKLSFYSVFFILHFITKQ